MHYSALVKRLPPRYIPSYIWYCCRCNPVCRFLSWIRSLNIPGCLRMLPCLPPIFFRLFYGLFQFCCQLAFLKFWKLSTLYLSPYLFPGPCTESDALTSRDYLLGIYLRQQVVSRVDCFCYFKDKLWVGWIRPIQKSSVPAVWNQTG